MPLQLIPSELSQLLRYVHEVEPPTLLNAFNDYLLSVEHGQSHPVSISWWTQVFGRRPDTIRQMLRHERPLEALMFKKLCVALKLSERDALALWLANAPAKVIGEICRADAAGGPKSDKYACAAPARLGLYRIAPARR